MFARITLIVFSQFCEDLLILSDSVIGKSMIEKKESSWIFKKVPHGTFVEVESELAVVSGGGVQEAAPFVLERSWTTPQVVFGNYPETSCCVSARDTVTTFCNGL